MKKQGQLCYNPPNSKTLSKKKSWNKNRKAPQSPRPTNLRHPLSPPPATPLPPRKKTSIETTLTCDEEEISLLNDYGQEIRHRISVATNCFSLKGEDKHSVITLNSPEYPKGFTEEIKESLIPAFYAGVFDGHDGPAASEYCRTGLLPHILSETAAAAGRSAINEEELLEGAPTSGPIKMKLAKKRRSFRLIRIPNTKNEVDNNTNEMTQHSEITDKNNKQHQGDEPRAEHKSTTTTMTSKQDTRTLLDIGFRHGYERCQERFSSGKKPPTLLDSTKGPFSTRLGPMSKVWSNMQPKRQGGTTALVMGLYLKKGDDVIQEDPSSDIDTEGAEGASPTCTTDTSRSTMQGNPQEEGDQELLVSSTSQSFLWIANTGDCRLLIDDQDVVDDDDDAEEKKSSFRQVTRDHRPSDYFEGLRLKMAQDRGECRLKRSSDSENTLRVYPGGLAVSRTIGDELHAPAVIPTPETYRVDLLHRRRYRIVMATDGLWDVVDNNRVSQRAAQVQWNEQELAEENITPEEAANRVMMECIRNQGFTDDITIMIMDIENVSTPGSGGGSVGVEQDSA